MFTLMFFTGLFLCFFAANSFKKAALKPVSTVQAFVSQKWYVMMIVAVPLCTIGAFSLIMAGSSLYGTVVGMLGAIIGGVLIYFPKEDAPSTSQRDQKRIGFIIVALSVIILIIVEYFTQ